jgi:hypothetical protein
MEGWAKVMIKLINVCGIHKEDGTKEVTSATVEHDDGTKEKFEGKDAEMYDYLIGCHVAVQSAVVALERNNVI